MYFTTGTADWFWKRRFSFTSSQAHGAFTAAIVLFKDDPNWISIAEYLFGSRWRLALGLHETEHNDNDNVNDEASDSNEESAYELFIRNFDCTTLHGLQDGRYLEAAIPEALSFAKSCVLSDHFEDNYAESSSEESSEDEVEGQQAEQGRGICQSEAEAKEKLRMLEGMAKKCLYGILLEYVPEPERCNDNRLQSELLTWLQKPNCIRQYMFRSNVSLKKLVREKGVKVVGRQTINSMVNALAGVAVPTDGGAAEEETPSNPEESVIKAVLKKSFLPHQKGAAREYCSLGHRLEKPILKQWVNLVLEARYPNPKVNVKAAYTAGLASKRGMPVAKDSIDFVLAVEDGDGDIETWGFEAKGRVTVKTAADEEDYLHSIELDDHLQIDASEVNEAVANVSERFQILHHAFVYDFRTVVLAIADEQAQLIRSLIVDFPPDLLESYKEVLQALKDLTLDWAYSGNSDIVQIPDKIFEVARSVETINGDEALQCAANLWRALGKLPSPFPSFKRLIPVICAYWNAVKSGSDTTTKLIDDRVLYLPFVNCETVTSARLVMIVYVLVHRCVQIITAREDLSYPSLAHYRNAASHRSTFHQSILTIKSVLQAELNKMLQPVTASPNQSQARRTQPTRARYDGKPVQVVNFGATLPFKTPKKLSKVAQSGTVEGLQVKKMLEACTGAPMKLVSKMNDKKKSCQYPGCNATTSWYCVKCKQWLCCDRRNVKGSKLECDPYQTEVRGEKYCFQKTCFHKFHEAAWTASSEHFNSD